MTAVGHTIAYRSTPVTAVTPPRTGRAAQFWGELAEPVTGRRVPGTVPVAIVAGLVSLVASAYLVASGLNLAYGDARAHLTIARRLFDTISNPGLGQLGTVWLPAPHVLLAPFVAWLPAWQSGWGAAALGAACLAATASALFRAAARLGLGRAGRLVAPAVVVLNPAILYLSSTALTEPVLIAAVACSVAGLANWTTRRRRGSPGELAVFAGIPAAVAVLSRYEGWALLLAGSLLVAVMSWRRSRILARVAADIAGFAIPPLLAIGWWLAFNWVTFHDPLAFLFGEFSANTLQAQMVADGLTTKGSLGSTLATLNTAVVGSVGPALPVLAGLALVLVVLTGRSFARLGIVAVAAVTYAFMFVSLYTGQAVILNAVDATGSVWNNRYGASVVLALALVVAWGVDAAATLARSRGWARLVPAAVAAVVAGALVGQLAWVLESPASRSLVLYEAVAQYDGSAAPRQAAAWLGAHYCGGMILMDESVAQNSVLPWAGIPLNQYYLRSTDKLFDGALADPAAHVRWVWVSAGDAAASDKVATMITASSTFHLDYVAAFTNEAVTIYRLADGS